MSETPTLTADERQAVLDWIIRDMHTKQVLKEFQDPKARRRLVDYAEIADELGFDEEIRAEYPIERSLPALHRVLTEWRDVADGWLNSGAEITEAERYRLEIWAKCQKILERLDSFRR